MKKNKKSLLTLIIFTLIVILYSGYILMNNFNVSKAELIIFVVIYISYMLFIFELVTKGLRAKRLGIRDDEDDN